MEKMDYQRYVFLKVEINTLKDLIEQSPSSCFSERRDLEKQKEEKEKELKYLIFGDTTEERTYNVDFCRTDNHLVLTKENARKRKIPGWNIRCNYCGSYGAEWISNERLGWGSLALCPYHEEMFLAEQSRHKEFMKKIQTINFEQDIKNDYHKINEYD
jgi:hypothetical protein